MVETRKGRKECLTVTRVGTVEEDDTNSWLLRVSYSPGAQVVYEGRCVPGEREVYVRPATMIDLIFKPIEAAAVADPLPSTS